MSLATTPRLGLPLLAAGQAQKEIVHNEALALADMLMQPLAESLDRNDPPSAALPGQTWVVGDAPTGAWAGHARAIAGWGEGGWRFVPAVEGLSVTLRSPGSGAIFRDGSWREGVVEAREIRVDGVRVTGPRRAAISTPSGGATVDAEARSAVAAILAALRAHGLIST